MGVLPCHRKGCENIMCGRYSPTYGYICDECFEERIELGPEAAIGDFMYTRKGDTPKEPYLTAVDRAEKEFPVRGEGGYR